MNKSVIGLIALVVTILVAGAIYFISTQDSSNNQTISTNSATQNNESEDIPKPEQAEDLPLTAITEDEVKKHNSEDDCWTIINGDVYDITSYIPRHPGGDEILRACGEDGTSLFNSRQTEDGESVGTGTPHSTTAQNQLQDYYKGDLQN